LVGEEIPKTHKRGSNAKSNPTRRKKKRENVSAGGGGWKEGGRGGVSAASARSTLVTRARGEEQPDIDWPKKKNRNSLAPKKSQLLVQWLNGEEGGGKRGKHYFGNNIGGKERGS